MSAAERSTSVCARERLLEGALRVYARDGLAGATTRAIAQEAGVNEVTLFRCFGTKEKLLSAVVEKQFGAEEPAAEVLSETDDLGADLRAYARRYEEGMVANLPLVRAFIGEAQQHQSHERKVLEGIFRPLRLGVVARLRKAQTAARLADVPTPEVLADLFTAMLFTGVLRSRTLYKAREYDQETYRDAAVGLILSISRAHE